MNTDPRHIEHGSRGELTIGCEATGCVAALPVPAPGDRLWVREAFYLTDDGESGCAVHAADEDAVKEHFRSIRETQAKYILSDGWASPHLRLRSSIHMPRWASRITLIVEAVKVERLQDISEDDADAECFAGGYPGDALPELFPGHRSQWSHLSIQQCFARLWESINGPGSWAANPWVAAYTFRVVAANIDNLPSPTGKEGGE